MRVLGAGDGVRYLLRSVAAGDGDRDLATPLTRYYSEAGTPPGYWLGSGLRSLGDGQLANGGEVSEAQLQLLIGIGCDPLTGEPLGQEYPKYATRSERVEQRVAELDPDLGPSSRAQQVEQIEAEEAQRSTRRAVAGYDYTFSIPKSASVFWAVADAGTQALIAEAHHTAVADIVDFIEREVAATRIGATGPDGAVAQADVEGVIATAFDHYDSRAGDPHLHTHVVISNKVRTVANGVSDAKWLSLDGRPMHAAVVALSEMHEAAFADRMTRVFGMQWEARDMGKDRNPAWSIESVPEELVQEFSTRARHIDAETDRLIAQYEQAHGRRPRPATIMKLRAQATLMTRPEKEVHSLAELTSSWRARASDVIGADATEWACSITQSATPPLLRADDVPLDIITEFGQQVVEVVGERRSTWRRWNLHAEASRQTMGLRFATVQDREAVTGLITDAAEAVSLRLTPPELASSPALFQRADGSSRFRPRHSTIYSTEALLEAEDRLLGRASDTNGPGVPLATVEKITARPDVKGRRLGADQAAALAAIAVSGRKVDVLVGPAGAGKTTAMTALRRAWEKEHGRNSVVGLAPSAVAAQVLGDDLGIETENTARWWQLHIMGRATFEAGQLVIIDEASLAGTHSLDRITAYAEEVGAKVLLVGDYGQLQSVDAGGSFSMLVHARDDAPELTMLHRFTHAWEKSTSLQLRHGDTDAIDALIAHDRVIGGEQDTMVDEAYAAWRQDSQAGRASILVAETHDLVTELNNRARLDLIQDGTVRGPGEIALHDGTAASVGDTVITRRNDRRLRGRSGWVRNGDRWTITRLREDGSVQVRPAGHRFGGGIVLPADYVAEHVELGYAVTAHRAQGVTVDTAHTVVTATTTRENFYVAMTRGRDANHAYVATDRPDEAHSIPHPADNEEATSRSVLYGVLQHVGAELSAHETITAEQERYANIGQLAAEYETIAQAAQHDRWASLLEFSGLTAEDIDDIQASDAYGALSAELRRAEANHHDLGDLFPKLVADRSLTDADDIASVLHERLARATARPAGSGRARQAPRLIAGLIPYASGVTDPDMHQALTERQNLIEERAAALFTSAVADEDTWVGQLGQRPHEAKRASTWRRCGQIVAAYRDRYRITGPAPLGQKPTNTAQKIDAARAQAALDRAQRLTAQAQRRRQPQNAATRQGPRL